MKKTRRIICFWAVAWLVGMLTTNLLHDAMHKQCVTAGDNTCAVCALHGQPLSPTPEGSVAAAAPVYFETAACSLSSFVVALPRYAYAQRLIPRAPPC